VNQWQTGWVLRGEHINLSLKILSRPRLFPQLNPNLK
jgi:hypothetical protein